MKRLMEKMVFSGFVIACRFATWPTRVSPSFVNATTEGVRRLPSWLAMTVGSPPSTAATTEFVVPRSIPITFAMSSISCWKVSRQRPVSGGAGAPPPSTALRHVDLDLLGLDRVHLGKGHRQHAVPVAGLHVVGLHGDRKLKDTLHASCPALATEVVLRLDGLGILALAPEAQHVSRDGYLNVFLAHAGKVHLHHQRVLRLVHVRGRSPRTLGHPSLCRAAEERVEEPIDLGLNVTDLPYPRPRLQHLSQRTPTHDRHHQTLLD